MEQISKGSPHIVTLQGVYIEALLYPGPLAEPDDSVSLPRLL